MLLQLQQAWSHDNFPVNKSIGDYYTEKYALFCDYQVEVPLITTLTTFILHIDDLAIHLGKTCRNVGVVWEVWS